MYLVSYWDEIDGERTYMDCESVAEAQEVLAECARQNGVAMHHRGDLRCRDITVWGEAEWAKDTAVGELLKKIQAEAQIAEAALQTSKKAAADRTRLHRYGQYLALKAEFEGKN